MPYRIHVADKHSLVLELSELLKRIPEDQTAELIVEAGKMLIPRELGPQRPVRKNKQIDPYWFEHYLISEADRYISSGDPIRAYMESLTETNHGHSGFTQNSRCIYIRPRNEAEKNISDEIRQMIIRVADALIESDPSSKEIGTMGDGWISITAIYDCLLMLGADVPVELIGRLRLLISQYKKIDSKNEEVPILEYQFKYRFG